MLRLAVVGDGIVAGYAAAAGIDAGAEVTVYSLRGEPTMPPPGAFYLYSLPLRMRDRYPAHLHHETVIGLELKLYTQRMWGEHHPSSIDKLFDEIVTEHKRSRELAVWSPSRPMVSELFQGVAWERVEQPLGIEDVLRLSGEYDLVAVAAPISFVDERPKVVRMPVLLMDGKSIESTPFQPMRESMVTLAELMAGLGDHVTFYNAALYHPWLRATIQPDHASFELPPQAVEELYWRAWSTDSRAVRIWVEFMKERTHMVPKIHPANEILNVAPDDNVVLCGRWATWDRHELSYETYNRVTLAIGEHKLLEDYGGE